MSTPKRTTPKALGSAFSTTPRFDIRKIGDWERARDLVGPRSAARIEKAGRRALRAQAEFARSKIVEGFRTQAPAGEAWKPLSPTTLAIRRFRGFQGSKALVVRGDLRSGITVRTHEDGYFVGIVRTKTSSDGRNLVNIAEINEYGRTIVMRATPKVIRLLSMAMRQQGMGGGGARSSAGVPGMLIIKIPARPMFKPVWAKWFSDTKAVQFRIMLHMARTLKGDYGYPGTAKPAGGG